LCRTLFLLLALLIFLHKKTPDYVTADSLQVFWTHYVWDSEQLYVSEKVKYSSTETGNGNMHD
jgi:hypothetical protein